MCIFKHILCIKPRKHKLNLLITGCAGFIGYHLSKRLINDGYNVLGIDNMNNYYDVKLKQNRLKLLQNHKLFKFHQIDLNDSNRFKKSLIPSSQKG